MGWLVYMIAMVATCYEGIMSLIFQPFMAAIVSAVCVGVSLLFGQLFRIPTLDRLWRSSRLIAIGLALSCIFLMVCGSSIGLTQTFIDQETGGTFVGLHSGVAFGCYLLLLFTIVNYPFQDRGILVKPGDHSGTYHNGVEP